MRMFGPAGNPQARNFVRGDWSPSTCRRSPVRALPQSGELNAASERSRNGAYWGGAPLSLAVGYSFRAFLYGVTATDPAAIATLLAAYLSARRAAASDGYGRLRPAGVDVGGSREWCCHTPIDIR